MIRRNNKTLLYRLSNTTLQYKHTMLVLKGGKLQQAMGKKVQFLINGFSKINK